jgi:hypothetical protein
VIHKDSSFLVERRVSQPHFGMKFSAGGDTRGYTDSVDRSFRNPMLARAMEFAFRKGKPPDCFQS